MKEIYFSITKLLRNFLLEDLTDIPDSSELADHQGFIGVPEPWEPLDPTEKCWDRPEEEPKREDWIPDIIKLKQQVKKSSKKKTAKK